MGVDKAHRGEQVSGSGLANYPSAEKRRCFRMCTPCVKGKHKDCETENCPCVCNDDDFKFKRVENFELYQLGLLEILKKEKGTTL